MGKTGVIHGRIPPEEILRYLGYNGKQNLEQPLLDTIQAAIEDMETVPGRYVTHEFALEKETVPLQLSGTNVALTGKDIAIHLKGCRRCILFALTTGIGVEKKIQYRETISIHEGLIWDAAASAYVEACCDALNLELAEQYRPQDLTSRFSCGYGDLPLSLQPQIIGLLQAPKQIGLTCNQNNILLPRKSVTAIIGIGAKPAPSKNNCQSCAYRESCTKRKSGETCGYHQ